MELASTTTELHAMTLQQQNVTEQQSERMRHARLPAGGPGRLDLVSDWGNMAAIEGPENNLVVDAETFELRLGYERSLGRRFAVRVSLPWRSIGGGSLDGLAESWHDLLGLPNGDRDSLPRDQIRVSYAAGGDSLLEVDSYSSGLGDVTLAGGYQVYDSGRTAVAAWLGVKLPSGDADRLERTDRDHKGRGPEPVSDLVAKR